jgi:hypothetical protein
MSHELYCPHCGEVLDAYVDPGGGERQEYIEDCAVCCRGVLFTAEYVAEEGSYAIAVIAER